MNKYRKVPIIIEAVEVTKSNHKEISGWLNLPINDQNFSWDSLKGELRGVKIKTLEGTMLANVGDYIIKGVNGEFYPCKPDIFEKSYEPVEVDS